LKNSSRLIIFLIVSSASLQAFGPKTFFNTRSQGVNAVRELAGWQQLINLDRECNYGAISIVPEYSRSFEPMDMAQFLFGCCPILHFSGSKVPNRSKTDILADYFGLPSDFKSKVTFEPRITNFVFDIDWYHGFDSWWKGGYIRVHIPITHTKWDLHLHECGAEFVSTATIEPAGYWGPDRIVIKPANKNQLYENVRQAFTGTKTYGDLIKPLRYGKIWGRQLMTRVADLQLVLGWNFLLGEDYHFGLNLRGTVPTGNAPNAEFLFEPIAGNGRHGEVGGGVTGHYVFWRSQDECHALGFYVDGNLTHLFDAHQKRSFDFKNNLCGNRYMLLETFDAPAENLFVAPDELAPSQYQRHLVPAINETTFDVEVKVAVQADVVAKLSYQRAGLELDLGYNFYARSREKLDRCGCLDGCFAFKGDAQVYGFDSIDEQPVPLSASQSQATIFGGQGAGNFVPGQEYQNMNADSPVLASDNNGNLLDLQARDAVALGLPQQQIFTSNPPILVTDCDICIESAVMPRQISNKIFGYAGYCWENPEGVDPYFGFGFAIEWAHMDPFKDSAYAQWQMWLKTGIAY
jgi:hypothetical protein